MPPVTPDYVPKHFPAGTTVKFTRSLDDYAPSDGWSYTIYLNGLTQKFNKTATVEDAGDFLIELLPSDTEGLAPGPYRYCERLTNSGCRFVLTAVESDGEGNAIYSFSLQSGLAPFVGMPVAVTGFTNGGNNVSSAIAALTTEDGVGTFTVPNGGAVNETAAAAAAGPGEVYDIRGDELVINIEPDAASSPAGTYQTFEEKTLAVIETAILGNLPAGLQSYQVAGRSVTKYTLDELMKLRGMFRAAVWRQQNPGKLGVPYRVEFTTEEENEYPPTWQDVTGLDR